MKEITSKAIYLLLVIVIFLVAMFFFIKLGKLTMLVE